MFHWLIKIIVGLTLVMIKLLGTGLSGAGVNPAGSLAAAIVSNNKWRSYDWIYYIGYLLSHHG
jgi:glycerol uptake facilitator-like aquaporin